MEMVTCLTGGTAVVIIIIALSVIQPCGASGLSRALSGKKDVPLRNAQPCCQDFRKSWNCELRRRHTARAKRRTTWGIDTNGCGNCGDGLPPPCPRVRQIPPGTHTVLSARHRLKLVVLLAGSKVNGME